MKNLILRSLFFQCFFLILNRIGIFEDPIASDYLACDAESSNNRFGGLIVDPKVSGGVFDPDTLHLNQLKEMKAHLS